MLTQSTPPIDLQGETCQRLMSAATEVFAEQGFHSATVREICRRAHTNVAAINYHFRDKEHLYTEVLRQSLRHSLEKYPLDLELGATATPAERLRAFIRSFLLRIFDNDPAAPFGRLMAREMIEPTRALDAIVSEVIRPIGEVLAAIVRDLLPAQATPDEARYAYGSVVGQCVYYLHSRPMLVRLHPELRYDDPAEVERLTGFITIFSLCALEGLSRRIAAR